MAGGDVPALPKLQQPRAVPAALGNCSVPTALGAEPFPDAASCIPSLSLALYIQELQRRTMMGWQGLLLPCGSVLTSQHRGGVEGDTHGGWGKQNSGDVRSKSSICCTDFLGEISASVWEG